MQTIDWNEINLSEEPAVRLLEALGYAFVPSEELEGERESLKEVILIPRLTKKLLEINPWLSEENLRKAVRAMTHVPAAGLMEANEKLHTSLAYSIAIEQDTGGVGKKSRDVFFIDFEHPEKNEFLVTRQFKVAGPKDNIICDIVLFVNGLPLAVIECKSPTIQEPINKGLKQLFRYQELTDEYHERGAPGLFETMQVLVAVCGQKARFGTVGTSHRHFSEWKEPWPLTLDELNKKYTTPLFNRVPTEQDVLLFGLFRLQNFLDLVRNFITFEVESGRTVKKIARYQQFIAVNCALTRIRKARDPKMRGGVIWHTQGSGKSLSMLWLALKLKGDPFHENPTIVVVTDRIDLDNQIVGTFNRCGFPNPIQAKSVANLRGELQGSGGQTVMTTIQKFKEMAEGKTHPVLTEAENVFVLVDEAHRTQYKSLAAKMRQALPNACFLGFTGTPIDKMDRSTRLTFGDYIHTYTIEQAVRDGATVAIYYESRLPEVRIQGENLDVLFERYFRDYSEKERVEIRRKYGTEATIAQAPARIEAICLDLIEHYENFIQPNGFKAQVVAVSREAAVTYKETLDRLNGPPSSVLISGWHNDTINLAKHHKTEAQEKEIIRSFKEDPADRLAILVVCDKLLTGFDAPIEQVMYLDSPLKEHNLLQAVARVNRTADKKNYGLIVDYWGVSRDLQEALGIFQQMDIAGALTPTTDELPRLEARHRVVMGFFERVDHGDLEACLRILEPEDVRTNFDLAFRSFSQSMDMVLPDPSALRYSADLKWLGKLRNAARVRFRDSSLDLSECGAKVRRLIEEHLRVNGVRKIMEPVSIFSQKFDEAVASLSTPDARSSEMEHAIRHEIHVHLEENPVFYQSLKEQLEQIIEARRQERLNAAEALKDLEALVGEMRNIGDAARELGLNETEYALYRLLSEEKTAFPGKVPEVTFVAEPAPAYGGRTTDPMEGADLQELTRSTINSLENLAVIDWIHKDDIQREMRREVKRILRQRGYSLEEVEILALKIMELARVRLKR
jgi:type I restriction enzyme R subunit